VGAAEVLARAVQRFAEVLTKTLDEAVEIEVKTYVAGDPDQGGQLRIVTRVGLGGDTENVVHEEEGELTEALWSVHRDSVVRAQAGRSEDLKMLASAARELLEVLKAS
jgi:hypothetical protein